MPYLNIDDGMDEHPKIEILSDAAFRLHISAMLYCSRRTTDGFIGRAKVRRLTTTATDIVVTELIDAGVWHDAGKGCDDPECIDARTCHADGIPGSYLLHDYLQWNHSKAWWDERRRRDAERQAEWRAKRGLPPKKMTGSKGRKS